MVKCPLAAPMVLISFVQVRNQEALRLRPTRKMRWRSFKTIGHSSKVWAPLRKLFARLVPQAVYGPVCSCIVL